MSHLEDYASIVGPERIDVIRALGARLAGRVIQNINSTAVGGGVAEILTRMTPLLKELGIEARWDVIRGNERFFAVTKAMHNGLHGVPSPFTEDDRQVFRETTKANLDHVQPWGDFVFIHDPQPVALIEVIDRAKHFCAWRCHIDFTDPQPDIWQFLKNYIESYRAAVFSAPAFARPLGIRQILIPPSIDPLADKNKDLPNEVVDEVCARFGLDRCRPIITQISRFDYLKDPVGVIRAYKMVKRHLDCQLVLAGGGATDDPEGQKVLDEVRSEAAGDPDVFVLFLPPGSDIEINALQRASTMILQKSLKEGFGLTVAEALWKAKPVIAGAVGGIPLQITHKFSGILAHSIEGTAFWIKQLLNTPRFASRLGRNGREHVRANFLITRHIRDYLLLFLSLENKGNPIVL
ncbi:MAG: glycosyltransferase [Candidatus Aminicenantes bacterium]|nr:glycosyltransferase [Candidatus Aminicenantes bacterium]